MRSRRRTYWSIPGRSGLLLPQGEDAGRVVQPPEVPRDREERGAEVEERVGEVLGDAPVDFLVDLEPLPRIELARPLLEELVDRRVRVPDPVPSLLILPGVPDVPRQVRVDAGAPEECQRVELVLGGQRLD